MAALQIAHPVLTARYYPPKCGTHPAIGGRTRKDTAGEWFMSQARATGWRVYKRICGLNRTRFVSRGMFSPPVEFAGTIQKVAQR
jgi:hypothetical protein